MSESQHLQTSTIVDAPIERVFALLADPDRHPDLDGSGTLRASQTHAILTQVGDEFTMDLHADNLGDYQTRSVVTHYERDRVLGWAPGPVDAKPFGHTFIFVLEAVTDDRTQVTETYDWSAVTDPQLLASMPLVTAEALTSTLDNLAEALR